MKTGILIRRPMPMGDIERHSVVRFGLVFVITKYLATVCGSKFAK